MNIKEELRHYNFYYSLEHSKSLSVSMDSPTRDNIKKVTYDNEGHPDMCTYDINGEHYVVPILDTNSPHNQFLINDKEEHKKLLLNKNRYEIKDLEKSDLFVNTPQVVDGQAVLFKVNNNDIVISMNEGEYITQCNSVFYKTSFSDNTIHYLEKYYLMETFDGLNSFFISKNDHEMTVIDSYGEIRSMIQFDRVSSPNPFLTYKIKYCSSPEVNSVIYDEFNEPVQIDGKNCFSEEHTLHNNHYIRKYRYYAMMRTIYDWGFPEDLIYEDILDLNEDRIPVAFARMVYSTK